MCLPILVHGRLLAKPVMNFITVLANCLIVSLQLSIQSVQMRTRETDDASSADSTTLQHDIHVFTSSCAWVSNQEDGASCLVATHTQNHLATCKGEQGLWGHLNFLGLSSNLDHKVTIHCWDIHPCTNSEFCFWV
jgi:hypothetical protein